ncbi:hypothetical protein SEEACDC1_01913, partial [Salmonella enterica subsp. enterica serovar Agona str. SA-1]
ANGAAPEGGEQKRVNPPLTAIFKLRVLYRSTGFLLICIPQTKGGMRTTDRGSTQKRRERF